MVVWRFDLRSFDYRLVLSLTTTSSLERFVFSAKIWEPNTLYLMLILGWLKTLLKGLCLAWLPRAQHPVSNLLIRNVHHFEYYFLLRLAGISWAEWFALVSRHINLQFLFSESVLANFYFFCLLCTPSQYSQHNFSAQFSEGLKTSSPNLLELCVMYEKTRARWHLRWCPHLWWKCMGFGAWIF